MMRRIVIASALLLSVVAQPAHAQQTVCPPGNLLAGKRPYHWQDIRGDVAWITDGKAAKEGAMWDAAGLAAVLESPAATVTYDLGQVTPVQGVYVQGDANDVLHLWGSVDGVEWKTLPPVEEAGEGVHGLRSRPVMLAGAAMRFLKIGEGVGDEFYSISEMQAFCQLPTPFPPVLAAVDAPTQKTNTPFWNDDSSRWWEFAFALMVFALLAWGAHLKEQGRSKYKRRLRNFLLALSLVVSFATYLNFFQFHFGNFIHRWDTFHYYVGAKYFKELGFERLYECVAIADAEEPGLRRRVELRKITNLRTNDLESTADILAHPERCRSHFTDQRWAAFKYDIAFFRKPESPKRWDDTSTDHGYNATPVWGILGTFLSNLSPASETQIFLINLLDPAYYVGMIAMVWWAFGWRVTAVAMAIFATNFPNRFYWTGGAMLRWDWLFYSTAAVCWLKKEKPLLAGLALGYATLLRVFPGFIVAGPGVALLVDLWRNRRATGKLTPLTPLSRKYVRFFAGGALAFAILIPLSFTTSHGVQSYRDFVKNSIKHKETPLTNYMGLRTVVAYRPSTVGRKMKDGTLTDPWIKWKRARIDGYHQALPLYLAIVAGWIALMGFAALRADPWMMAAFGTTFIPIAVELTCYYYAFIMGVALLHKKRKDVGRLLLLLTAASEFISLSPIPGMATWIDEQYTLISALTVLAFGMILWRFAPDAQVALSRWSGKLFDKLGLGGGDDDDEDGEGEASPGGKDGGKDGGKGASAGKDGAATDVTERAGAPAEDDGTPPVDFDAMDDDEDSPAAREAAAKDPGGAAARGAASKDRKARGGRPRR